MPVRADPASPLSVSARRRRFRRVAHAGFALSAAVSAVAFGATCESLKNVSLPDTTITSAQQVPAGTFTPPDGQAAIPNLPAFCRVTGTTLPSIKFEVWLPSAASWNQKFQGVGNGGTAGIISYSALGAALLRGYATASTDTGHVSHGSFDATWALNRPDLVRDFGYRGTHVMSVNGQRITRTFYGERPRHNYFVGCSKGGQQALMEAQRYPEDYDGIIGGDPANNWVHFYSGGHLWYSLATLDDPQSYFPAGLTTVLGNAVNAQCDAIDGIKDGILNDPRQCHFDPSVLTCKAGQDPSTCFTPKQVEAVRKIYSGVRTSRGELVYPGLLPGGEAGAGGWAAWTTGSAPFTGLHWQAASGFFADMVFNDPNWNFRTFNYDTDVAYTEAKVGFDVDAVNPDLRPLRARGGKLIMYHGFSDPDISPVNSINYYNSVVAETGSLEDTQRFARLFMVPGMQHCSGGPGPNTFDMLTALEQWVEHGTAPKQVIASHVTNGTVDRTRPLCPWPQKAVYTGSGSTDVASSFVCRGSRGEGDEDDDDGGKGGDD